MGPNSIPDIHERRIVDFDATDSDYNITSMVAKTSIGNRSTDNTLNKQSQNQTIVSKETFIAPNDLLISRTDMNGVITQCNDLFITKSGWNKKELIGSNHNLIRHPEMPQVIFKLAWDHIQNVKAFYGYFKNLRKDGGFYWVFAFISADVNDEGRITGYTSYSHFVSQETINVIEPIYTILCKAELHCGVIGSEPLFKHYLEKTGFSSYDKFTIDVRLGCFAHKHSER